MRFLKKVPGTCEYWKMAIVRDNKELQKNHKSNRKKIKTKRKW